MFTCFARIQHSKEKIWACQSDHLTVNRKSKKRLKILFMLICMGVFSFSLIRSYFAVDSNIPVDEKKQQKRSITSQAENELFDYTNFKILFASLSTTNFRSRIGASACKASHPAAMKTVDSACFVISVGDAISLSHTSEWRKNIVLINVDSENELTPVSNEMIVQANFATGTFRHDLDIHLFADVKRRNNEARKHRPPIMPLGRKKLSQIVYSESVELEEISSHIPSVRCNDNCDKILVNTTFCLLPSSRTFQWRLLSSLRAGCIPVVLSNTQPLPFHKELDWKLASLRYPLATMRFVPQLLERLSKEDILELRRKGRIFLERLDNAEALADTLVASLSERIMVELPPFYELAQAASHSDTVAGKTSTLSRSLPPPSSLYSYRRWNNGNKLTFAPSLLHDVPMMPGGAAFHKGTNEKVISMNSEIGSKNSNDALGLTRDEEKFTVVILTYDRVDGVAKIFNTLRNCPFLNKIIVVWNNNNSSPPADWLDMNDPFEIIIPKKNSLNNRFIPYESIETEAVISMDDDVYVTQSELVFAFRMWRENRNRIVGFPERFHTKVNGESKYGLVPHHEYSMILTGLAIIHKEFLFEFTYNQHPAILEYIDEHFNCEDIAMNYLIAHLTRRPPLRVQKKTSLSNGSKVGLFSRTLHVRERDECMDMLNDIYGYNPLLFSQEVAVPLSDQCAHPSWRSTLFGL